MEYMQLIKWKFLSVIAIFCLTFFCAQGYGKKDVPSRSQRQLTSNKNNAPAESARPLPSASDPDQLYGVTIERVDNLPAILASLKEVNRVRWPITRIVFQPEQKPAYYLDAIKAIRQESSVMGLIADSSAMHRYKTVKEYESRVSEYLTQLGDYVNVWEIGNEVNGEWVGWKDDEWQAQSTDRMAKKRQLVSDQIRAAFNIAKARGVKTALTLYYNDDGVEGHQCWPDKSYGPEYAMFTWVNKYIADTNMKEKLDYVFVSFYEDDCPDLKKDPQTWVNLFKRLSVIFPNAKVGFGEFGPQCPMCRARDCRRCIADQKEFIPRYYKTYNSLIKPAAPKYVGGFFYWYFWQDMVPKERPALSELVNAIKD